MSIHFHLYYSTQFGENLFVKTELQRGDTVQIGEHPLTCLNDALWHGTVELQAASGDTLRYHYEWRDQHGNKRTEWGSRQIALASASPLEVYDCWTPPGAPENAFETQAFRVLASRPSVTTKADSHTHTFRVKAPMLHPDEVVCLLGHGKALRAWDTQAPILLHPDEQGWSIALDLSSEDFPLGYKYGVWNTRTKAFQGFEEGANRALYQPHTATKKVILHDSFARFPLQMWRGAGVAIPVFSLRSDQGFGVGEFADLPALTGPNPSV